MNAERRGGPGQLGRGGYVLAVLGLVSGAALAGGAGPAAAASHLGASAPGAPRAAAGMISTIAGGVGGPGRATTVSLADCGVTFGRGSLYIADTSAVRQVTANDYLTTPAGTGVTAGPAGDGGPASRADLETCGVALDHSGNLVIAEQDRFLVTVAAAKTGRFYGQQMRAGDIYTVAGDGNRGRTGSGAAATRAALSGPVDAAVDRAGNLVIADSGYKVRPLDKYGSRLQVVAVKTGRFYGQQMKAGEIYTVAGNGGLGYSGDGGPATKAALGLYVGAVRIDGHGNLVFADTRHNAIRVVAATTGTFYGRQMTAGDIYTVAGDGIPGFTGDGGPATSARLDFPQGVALDAAGNVVIADTVNDRIRVVAASTGRFYGRAMTAGDIYTVAGDGSFGFSGDGGPATSAELNNPEGVAVDDATGNLLIADYFNLRVRVVAGKSGTFYGQAMTAGDIYTMAGRANDGFPYSGDGGPAGRAEFYAPSGVAADAAGNLAIADYGEGRIRLVAAKSGTLLGQAVKAGDVYTVAGDGRLGFSGDGSPARRAELAFPGDVAWDRAGNLVVADTNNNRIRVVARSSGTFYGQAMTAGDIYTVAGDGTSGFSGDGGPATKAELGRPGSAEVDATGNLLIDDTGNNRIRVVARSSGTFYGQAMTAGDIYTVAGDGNSGFSGDGGPATKAELNFSLDTVPDGAGNLVIADTGNNRVRVVARSSGTFYGQAMTAGDIYTVAGSGIAGFSGDGGPAVRAELNFPESVATDGSGNVLIADTTNDRVRVVAARAGTFYGVTMKPGDVYTVAGDGSTGFSGDGGPATSAELNGPGGVTVAGGGILISDNRRIRMVTG